jgi:hypothetical protein
VRWKVQNLGQWPAFIKEARLEQVQLIRETTKLLVAQWSRAQRQSRGQHDPSGRYDRGRAPRDRPKSR